MQPPNLTELSQEYRSLDKTFTLLEKDDDPAKLLITFELAPMPEGTWPADSKVWCEYNELTALCPWTNLPDQGSIFLEYTPDGYLLELKSYKYYLLSFRDRHITQEHLAQKVYHDLGQALSPKSLKVILDYMPRGGIHTVFELNSNAIRE